MDALIAKSLAHVGEDYAASGIYEAALPNYTPNFPPAQVEAILSTARTRKDKNIPSGVLTLCGRQGKDSPTVDASLALTTVAGECAQLAMQVARGVNSPVLAVAATVLPLPVVFHFFPAEPLRWHAMRKVDAKIADFGAIVAVTACRIFAFPNQANNGTRDEWAKCLYGGAPTLFPTTPNTPQSSIPVAGAAPLDAKRGDAILSELSPGEVYLCHASVPFYICGATDGAPFLAARVHFELGADASKHLAEWKALWKADGFANSATAFGGLCKHWMPKFLGEPLAGEQARFPVDKSVFDVPPWLGHLMEIEAPPSAAAEVVAVPSNPRIAKMREMFAAFEVARDALLAKNPRAWSADWEKTCRTRMADAQPDDTAMRSFKNAHKVMLAKVAKCEEALPLLETEWAAIEAAEAMLNKAEGVTDKVRAKYALEIETLKANFAEWAIDPKRNKGTELKIRAEKTFLNIPYPKKTVPASALRFRPIDWREGELSPLCTLAEISELYSDTTEAFMNMFKATAELRKKPEAVVLETSFAQIKQAMLALRDEITKYSGDSAHMYERGKCDTVIGYLDETSQAINRLKELPRREVEVDEEEEDYDEEEHDEANVLNNRMTGFIPGPFERARGVSDQTRRANCEGCEDEETVKHTLYSALGRCAACSAGDLKECVGHLDAFYKGSEVLVENREKFDKCYKKLRAQFVGCIEKLNRDEKPGFELLRKAVFAAADQFASLTDVENEEEAEYEEGMDDGDVIFGDSDEEEDEDEEDDYDMDGWEGSEDSLPPPISKGTKRSREDALQQEIVLAARHLPVMDVIKHMADEHYDGNYGNVEKALKTLKATPVLYAIVRTDADESTAPTLMFRNQGQAETERARLVNPDAYRVVALPVEERWPSKK